MEPEREQEHSHRFHERWCRATLNPGPARVRSLSQKGERESKNNETTAAFFSEPSEQMIQSRSLPGYRVSSSLTGGGAQRKLGAFDSPVVFQLQKSTWIPCDRTIRGAL